MPGIADIAFFVSKYQSVMVLLEVVFGLEKMLIFTAFARPHPVLNLVRRYIAVQLWDGMVRLMKRYIVGLVFMLCCCHC